MKRLCISVLVMLLSLPLALSCGSATVARDAGPADAGPADAAASDLSRLDVGIHADRELDVATSDVGLPDVRPALDVSSALDSSCDPLAHPDPNLGLVEPDGVEACPPGQAPVSGGSFCIDRWEAFLVELGDAGERTWSPYFNPGDRTVVARSAPGAVPQGYVSGDQAAAACARAGKRLCTRAEWELACRGPSSNVYPYGPERQDGVCNDARSEHPAIEYFETSDSWIWSELDHPCLNQLADGLALGGEHPGCVTADGVHDLMGNLHEWIDDPAGTFKGGFYVDTRINGEGCLYTTTAHGSGYWDYSTGFRCCGDR